MVMLIEIISVNQTFNSSKVKCWQVYKISRVKSSKVSISVFNSPVGVISLFQICPINKKIQKSSSSKDKDEMKSKVHYHCSLFVAN